MSPMLRTDENGNNIFGQMFSQAGELVERVLGHRLDNIHETIKEASAVPPPKHSIQRTISTSANKTYTDAGIGAFGAGDYSLYAPGLGVASGGPGGQTFGGSPSTYPPPLGKVWDIGQIRVRALMPAGGANTHDIYIAVFRNFIPALGSAAQRLDSSRLFTGLQDALVSISEYEVVSNRPVLADFINNPEVHSGEFLVPMALAFAGAGEVNPDMVYWQISVEERDE